MTQLTFGVIGTSRKKNETRVPLHPDHLERLSEDVRRHLVFEEGYGQRFGWSDAQITEMTGGVTSRREILSDIGAAILAKPMLKDLEEMPDGGILWGYPHCAQQGDITQAAIDRKLTLIAFEDMYVWSPRGRPRRHTFYKNNELAGYCAVLHATHLSGINGHYGNNRKVVIFGFGAVSFGAISALQALGFQDITVCTKQPDYVIREEVLGCSYMRLRDGRAGEPRLVACAVDGTERPLSDLISETDILINGIFQDPNNPLLFVTEKERDSLKAGALVIDVSCDEGMGFYFAKPTGFDDPMFWVGDVGYYAVDHTPCYLWESASRCLSEALVPHVETVLAGRDEWQGCESIRQAINTDEGVIQKPAILEFQGRAPDYPHSFV